MKFTVILAIAGLGWAALLGIPLGCLSAVQRKASLINLRGCYRLEPLRFLHLCINLGAFFLLYVQLFPVIGAENRGTRWIKFGI
ncbi:MAG: hypothetical protein CM1200mP39_27970 [Dehalococcoidia bacterium]|nr:MAG: hypothetical protein CM1200mP39_27970 [Dehalococcoidia bacterium]